MTTVPHLRIFSEVLIQVLYYSPVKPTRKRWRKIRRQYRRRNMLIIHTADEPRFCVPILFRRTSA